MITFHSRCEVSGSSFGLNFDCCCSDEMSDDKIISLHERLAENETRRLSKPTELATQKIRDIAVKSVIYPRTVTPREAQELGAAVLYHLKLFYPTLSD